MRGFGAFVVASLLLSALLLLHASRMRAAEASAFEIARSSQSFEKIGFLCNVLQKSHEKIIGSDSAWRMEVQELAAYYGVDIIIDGQKATIVDNSNFVRSEFYLE